MPLIRPDALPIAAEEVATIRARLTQPFQFEVVRRDEVRCLFVRSDRNEPDPVNDLESALNEVPDWALTDLSDVVLLGNHQNFHVPARATHATIERRHRIDQAALQTLRASLDPHYGVGLHRVTGDPTNTTRLGMRIPRTTVKQLDDPDLNRLAAALGPLIDAGELHRVRFAYLLAEKDHVRLRGTDVAQDLAPRWQEAKNTPQNPPPAPAPTRTAPPGPIATPAPPKARRRPKRSIRVTPIVQLETHMDAIGVEEQDQALLAQAETHIEQRLAEGGYDVARNVQNDGIAYAMAAERAAGYPRRVLVRLLRRCDRTDADLMLRAVRATEADLLLCLCPDVTDAAHRRLLATKVKLLDPRQASTFRL